MLKVLICLIFVAMCAGLRIGVAPFPELGHLNPFMSIVVEASKKGYHVDIFGPEFFMKSCRREAGETATCLSIGSFDMSEYDEKFFQELVEKPVLETLPQIEKKVLWYNNASISNLLDEARSRHQVAPYDVFLVDFGQWGAVAVADVLHIPVVMVWPLVLQFPIQQNPSIPPIGFAISAKMDSLQRTSSYLFQRLSLMTGTWRQAAENEVRGRIGAAPIDQFDYYYRRWVITPSIFGLDVAQSLCPNVVPVGFLRRPIVTDTVLPEEWTDFLGSCSNGTVYFNMGSLAVLPDSWAHKFLNSIKQLTERNYCVVWKLSKMQLKAMSEEAIRLDIDMRLVRLSSFLPFSPRILLSHSKTKVFITHCGDTSVYESIESEVPMIGIGLFADQPDMCQRLDDAGVGVALDKFSFAPNDIVSGVEVLMSGNVTKKLTQLHHQGIMLGGSKRALEVIETAAEIDVSLFRCMHVDLPNWEFFDVDVVFCVVAFLLLTYALIRNLLILTFSR